MTSSVPGVGPVAPRDASRLRVLNLVMAGLHLLQGLAMVSLASGFTLPVTAAFVGFDPSTETLKSQFETLFDLRLAPVVAGFLFLSALAHAIIAAPGVFPRYLRGLGEGVNFGRWAEYSVSASVMIVAIAMLVGIYDIASLVLIFGANAAMILFGWVAEAQNRGRAKVDWTPFIFGCIIGAFPWVAIAIYLVGAGNGEGDVPGFVYAIFISIFLFFNVFAVNMWLQYRRVGPWRRYLFGEYVYIFLSLGAKSALAWQVFAGTLQPN